MRSFFLLLYYLCAALAAAQSTVNLSEDLVSLGIASQNMVPNMSALDSQPLLTAAIAYAQSNASVTALIADPGAYYFLTAAGPAQYIFLGNVSNLTLDFQGSNLYFQDGTLRAFEVDYCKRVTLQNFTIDQIVPRYTQVKLTAIDAVNGVFSYTVPAGWADPASFAPSPFGAPEFFAAFFRNGVQVPATSLVFLNAPIKSPKLTAILNGEPWTQPNVLSTLKPGDMAAIWDRSGLESISVYAGDSITLSNIEVHGSGGGFAVAVGVSSNSVADNVRVRPRDGGLIGSNADGIHFSFSIANNHIRNCYVTGTTDDAIAMDSDYIASVTSQPSARQLVMARNSYNRVSNGAMMNFVHLADGSEVSGAVVVTQDPPDQQNVNSDESITFTFDRDLPALAAGDEMIFAAANMRGAGSTIEDNFVENIPVGRGIYLGGLENVLVQRNVIRGTSNAGIDLSEVTVLAGGGGLPSNGVTIQSNAIENVLGPQASGAGAAIVNQAGIVVSSNDPNFNFIATPVNANVSIVNNYVAGSGRAGIWVGEVNGGSISNNTIVNWNQYPGLPVWNLNPFPQDFSEPLVVRFSQNVTMAGNITQATSTLQGPMSFSPSSASVGAGGGTGTFSVISNVGSFAWYATSDSDWITITGSSSGVGNGALSYLVAPNTGAARIGSVTPAGVSFVITQASAKPVFTAAGVASAASYAAGTVSPGEIVTIFGSSLGPSTLAGAALNNSGLVSTQVADTQITFDGVPAPIVYVSATQSSVIVPYEVHGGTTQVMATYNGLASAPVTLTVAPSVPGLFTANASGKGPGAFLNVDGSLNSASNPAAKGSIVTLFATGEGMTSPAGVDGKLASPPYTAPVLPVSVTIDGVAATVDYKGGAPGEVAGVMQLNVTVPAAAHSGNVAVVLTIGSAQSPSGVTLAVK